MESIVELMSTIGIFIGAILILVLIHELGHFLAAKFFGMRVERFSVGFPPNIYKIKKGETEYCLGATPLGGYVNISGMIDESMDTDHLNEEPKPWEFRSKPVWQRIIVISAGVIFNMILAVMIFAGIALSTGEQRIPIENVPGMYAADTSLVHEVGFQTGDKLVGVNGERPKYYSEFTSPERITSSDLSYTVLRNGQEVTLQMPSGLLDQLNSRPFIGTSILQPQLGSIQPNSPADSAGLQPGDRIVAVNGEPVSYWMELVGKIKNGERPLQLTVNRGDETLQVEVTPNEENIIGIAPQQNLAALFGAESIEYGFMGSLKYGYDRTAQTLTGIIQGFGRMFSGDISVRENLGGPVAIAQFTKSATDAGGWLGFWSFTAFLSVTLAIMNILPIPALDGGHLMFLIYEGITRREPSEKVRMAMQQIGFLIIIALFILITFNDILRLF